MEQPPVIPHSSEPTPTDQASNRPFLLPAIAAAAGIVAGILIMLVVTQLRSTPTPTPQPTPDTTTTTPAVLPIDDPSVNHQLNIQWQKSEPVNPATTFHGLIPETFHGVYDLGGTDAYDQQNASSSMPYQASYTYYKRGQVQDGLLAGATVYQAMLVGDRPAVPDLGGPYLAPAVFTFVAVPAENRQDARIYLAQIGQAPSTGGYDAWFPPGLIGANAITSPQVPLVIPNSVFPNELVLTNGKKLVRSHLVAHDLPIEMDARCSTDGCIDRAGVGQTQEGYAVFSSTPNTNQQMMFESYTQPGCMIVYGPTGEGTLYYSMIDTAATDPSNPERPIPVVTKDQIHLQSPYIAGATFSPFAVGGCGGIGCPQIIDDQQNPINLADWQQIGTTTAGDPLYFPKQPKTNDLVREQYEGWFDYQRDGSDFSKKPSIDVFLQRMPFPLFIWRDGFGRWVKYHDTAILPMAECGKPVIYLYPTKTQTVNVSLPSFINVTVSEPTYPATGWNVTAQPNGQITMQDGSQYGSLYWEGTGVNYPAPTTGFIVHDGQVTSFLKTTLAKYGLNTQESKEFMDFWVPKMMGAPYYRVSFLTDDWSKAAPLNVTPAPNTRIRLFMDWQKLAAPISIQEPTIKTPTRNGFTLVEWGGLLHK